jgi:NADP-dependent aldehyde dehydrogenase
VLAVNGKNCIGYEDSATGTTVFHAVDPSANRQLPTIFTQASETETERAVRKAETAFRDYANLPLKQRGTFLHAIAAAIRTHRNELIRWFSIETGLSEERAAKELERSCYQFESYVDGVVSGYALEAKIDVPDEVQKTQGRPDLRKMNMPLGPVVVFGASNFPFAYSTIGGDVASALAAGCPVIVKGHPMHPHTSELSARIILDVARKLGLPDGVFSHLHAADYAVGEMLVGHPAVKAVGFTGSIRGGMALHRISESRRQPIPVYAEMGSSNPIVFSDAALAARGAVIAQEVAASIANDAGQFCTSPGLLFVIASETADAFINSLVTHLSRVPPQVMLHPDIFRQYSENAGKQLAGAEVLVSGSREKNRIRPALVRVPGRQFLADAWRQEEVFGSFATVIRCSDEAELKACLASLNGQLTASIYIGENENTGWLADLQRFAGRIIVNGVPTGVTVTTAMQHGGPFPSSNHPGTSAVGPDAVKRFMRPVSFQNCPDELLPEALKRTNPLGILRFVNGLASDMPC